MFSLTVAQRGNVESYMADRMARRFPPPFTQLVADSVVAFPEADKRDIASMASHLYPGMVRTRELVCTLELVFDIAYLNDWCAVQEGACPKSMARVDGDLIANDDVMPRPESEMKDADRLPPEFELDEICRRPMETVSATCKFHEYANTFCSVHRNVRVLCRSLAA